MDFPVFHFGAKQEGQNYRPWFSIRDGELKSDESLDVTYPSEEQARSEAWKAASSYYLKNAKNPERLNGPFYVNDQLGPNK